MWITDILLLLFQLDFDERVLRAFASQALAEAEESMSLLLLIIIIIILIVLN